MKFNRRKPQRRVPHPFRGLIAEWVGKHEPRASEKLPPPKGGCVPMDGAGAFRLLKNVAFQFGLQARTFSIEPGTANVLRSLRRFIVKGVENHKPRASEKRAPAPPQVLVSGQHAP